MNSVMSEKAKEKRNIAYSLPKKKLPNNLYQAAGMLRYKAKIVSSELQKNTKQLEDPDAKSMNMVTNVIAGYLSGNGQH